MTDRKILNRKGVNSTAVKLMVTAVIMFGFGFSLVPLYDILCEVTGLNGKTGVISQQQAKSSEEPQDDRLVKVQFVTNVAVGLPWKFKALEKELFVRPGKLTFTNFEATNVYFYSPSRHSIDGETFDLEVNIYHGNFNDGTNERGQVSHYQYHQDKNNADIYHKHFH